MNAPQITLIVLWSISLGISLQQHGKPKTGNENVLACITAIVITASILWWGGFWS